MVMWFRDLNLIIRREFLKMMMLFKYRVVGFVCRSWYRPLSVCYYTYISLWVRLSIDIKRIEAMLNQW